MFNHKNSKAALVFMSLIFIINYAVASVDIPLSWHSIKVNSNDQGGASIYAELDGDKQLSKFEVMIKGKLIDIPESCTQGLNSPYLNGLKLLWGRRSSNEMYWVIKLPYSGTKSVELESQMVFVFSSSALISSSTRIQITSKKWKHTDICSQTGKPGRVSVEEVLWKQTEQ